MANPPSRESNSTGSDVAPPPDFKVTAVKVSYQARKSDNTIGDFEFDVDVKKTDGIIWNDKIYAKVVDCTTEHNWPEKEPGELPQPRDLFQSGRKSDREAQEVVEPSGTCCFINGRWICW